DPAGRALLQRMPAAGGRAYDRWRRAWEPQSQPSFCGPASALAALRFFRLQAAWTQQDIYQKVIAPHGLFTKGLSLAHGVEMLRLLSAGRLRLEERCLTDEAEMSKLLSEDLARAFEEGVEMCLLVNYWRPWGGHWSPLAGWSEGKVLIMDTNAQRLPPHWVPLSTLVKALCRLNEVTGRPRGYVVLRPAAV
ncbi:unnamed protein product, partial [Polarella glacialis]